MMPRRAPRLALVLLATSLWGQTPGQAPVFKAETALIHVDALAGLVSAAWYAVHAPKPVHFLLVILVSPVFAFVVFVFFLALGVASIFSDEAALWVLKKMVGTPDPKRAIHQLLNLALSSFWFALFGTVALASFFQSERPLYKWIP